MIFFSLSFLLFILQVVSLNPWCINIWNWSPHHFWPFEEDEQFGSRIRGLSGWNIRKKPVNPKWLPKSYCSSSFFRPFSYEVCNGLPRCQVCKFYFKKAWFAHQFDLCIWCVDWWCVRVTYMHHLHTQMVQPNDHRV